MPKIFCQNKNPDKSESKNIEAIRLIKRKNANNVLSKKGDPNLLRCCKL